MEISTIIALITAIAFIVNITVQVTKNLIPVPTQLWTIIVSAFATTVSAFAASDRGFFEINFITLSEALAVSFVVAYIAMYGFDTFKDLWLRFKDGENINEKKEK